MSEHTATPWKVFTTPDGRRLVGIGAENGEGTLDAGFGVWAWDDPAGIANANLVVKAVNSHDALVTELQRLFELYGHQATKDVLDNVGQKEGCGE